MKLVRTSHWARNCVLTKFDTLTALPYYQQAFRLDVGAWLSLVERTVRDREVGGSNPLAPTNQFKHLRLPAKVAVLVLWQDCGRRADSLVELLPRPPFLLDPSHVYSAALFADRNVPSDRQSSLH